MGEIRGRSRKGQWGEETPSGPGRPPQGGWPRRPQPPSHLVLGPPVGCQPPVPLLGLDPRARPRNSLHAPPPTRSLDPRPSRRSPSPARPPLTHLPRRAPGSERGRDGTHLSGRSGGEGAAEPGGGGVERRPARATPPTSGGTSGGGQASAPERRGRGGTRAAPDGALWRPEPARSGPGVGSGGDADLAETAPRAKMLVDSARAKGLERWRPREGLEIWRREKPSLGRL